MDPCRHPQRKRHAQVRHQPRATPLWVGDPDDWAMVRREPRPPLVCPEPGCEVELISYENRNNKYNPLIFKFKSVDRSCDHWSDCGQGGGPESAQHEWMKLRLTRIAQGLGFTATPEHSPTHSDVFVHEPEFCLEVQLVPTQFGKRTAARQGKGAAVCWLIREGLDTPKALQALFELPAVRFRIVDHTNRKGRLLAPWEAPDDRDLARSRRTTRRLVPHRLDERIPVPPGDPHRTTTQAQPRTVPPVSQHTSTDTRTSPAQPADVQGRPDSNVPAAALTLEADPPTVALPVVQHIPPPPLAVHKPDAPISTKPSTSTGWRRWLFWRRKQ